MRRRWFIAIALLGIAGLWAGLRPREPRQLVSRPPLPPAAHAAEKAFETSTATAPETPREEGNTVFRVTDAGGAALAGVPVRVWRRGPFDPAAARFRWSKLPELRTRRDGTARTNVEPGTYYAAAHAPGRAPARRVFSRFGEIALTVPAPASLSGRVQDAATHEPIPLADLKLIPTATELESAEPPDDEQLHVASGPDGLFAATGLAPGGYVIEAQAAGYGRSRMPELETPDSKVLVQLRPAAFVEGRVLLPGGEGAARAEITASREGDPSVTEADANGAFSLQLEPGAFLLSARSGELTVRVTRPLSVRAGATLNAGTLQLHQGGSMEVEVADSKGAPVAGAEVIVSPFGFGGATAGARTASSGRTAVKGLPEGSYDLDVLAEGYARHLERGLVVGPAQAISRKVVLDGKGALAGTVRDGSGNPVEGAVVRAQPLMKGFASGPAVTARSEAAGRYRLEGLPAGAAHVAALPAEQAALGTTRTVPVAAGETAQLDLVLDAFATITGHVDGAEPGKRALVRARLEQVVRSVLDRAESPLDADGRYTLKVPPGRWLLQPFHPGQTGERREAGKSVDVTAGQTLELDLAFDRGNDAVTGQVLEPTGAPASNAWIVLRNQGRYLDSFQADEDGRFRIARARDLPASTVVVAGKRERSAEAPLGQGELTIRLRAGAALHGRVTSEGQPAPTASLKMVVLDSTYSPGMAYQISGGSFAIDDAPAGRVLLTCTLPSGALATQEVTLQEGEDREVDFNVAPAARVRGRIVDRSGAAVAGLIVRGFPNGEGAGISDTTGPRGEFAMLLPSRGLLVLTATLPMRHLARHVQVDQAEVDLGDLPLEDNAVNQ